MRAVLLLVVFTLHFASITQGQPTAPDQIDASYQQRKQLAASSILKDYPVRNIGPVVQGGRIVDIEVNSNNTKEFYVAYASGGIFKTVNNGISFEPVFDQLDAMGIGDFALSQKNPNVLYVGTGEKNSSRSSYAGSGLYKSADGGKTWTHLALTGTQHIGKVIIHPQNDNVVWVASLGALYSPNSERGVYKTTDGGKTWNKTLFINDSTGVTDLVINPSNPDQLWASSWERSRTAWDFKGNGAGSSIYRSNDGGETWEKAVNGFPQGKQVGRIGLAVTDANPNVVYAILDNQAEVDDRKEEPKKKEEEKLKLDDFRKMSNEDLLKLDNKKLDEFLTDNGFPRKYNAQQVKTDVRSGKYNAKDIGNYFGTDANANLFNTKILGAELYRSDDGGNSWKKMNSYDLDGVFFSYGYYFAEMKASPKDPNLIYIYGVPMLKSRDGGVTWHRLDTLRGEQSIHVDHHALWIDPHDPDHMLLGNDGGLYQTYDEGAQWIHINNVSVGQFYTINVDMETPYNVYGGLQDNNVFRGSSESIPNQTEPWEPLLGGDGMFVAPDPRNINIVYAGFQFGNYFRLELNKSKRTRITPRHNIGEAPLRWNWRAPLIMSSHNADIIYMAAQRVYRSFDKGETWQVISDDLTKDKKQGNVPYSTIASLAESPLKFGLLYAGTDDGNLWVSRDAGGNWEAIRNGLPDDLWVSSVSPSSISESTVFISLNGYRCDNFKTYLYKSSDYGKTWTSVKGNLPESVANVIIQDPVNPDLLYCGLDNGTYVSLDGGSTWNYFNAMLNVPSYDMLVHPRENELVVGTHGRSAFVADVKPLQQLKDGSFKKAIVVFAPESVRYSERWGEKQYPWSKANEPEAKIFYYSGTASPVVTVEVFNDKKELIRKTTASGTTGFHTWTWDLKAQSASTTTKGKKKPVEPAGELKYVEKGKYTVTLTNGGESGSVTVEVKGGNQGSNSEPLSEPFEEEEID